ncbi:MAG: S8 family serine peptidase [Proteobacteria bacterium]|nr:S8 family serine peptidase [Pseudomonadota bacterium]
MRKLGFATALTALTLGLGLAEAQAQFRGNTPMTGGGVRVPGGGGRGGFGIGLGAGILVPGLIEAVRPRGPVYVEEYDVEEERPRRPRGTKARPKPAPKVARQAPPPRQARPAAPRVPPVSIPVASEQRLVPEEVLIEVKNPASAEAVLRRHRLTQLAQTRFELANTTIIRARIEGGRTARQALQQMAGDARIASAQPNYVYTLQEEAQKVAVSEPPPPPARKEQYVLDKLGLTGAQKLASGEKIRIALVDTGVDDAHPELSGAVVARFEAVTGETNSREHGTAMAGALVARASLRGAAPQAQLLSARAFGGDAKSSGTSFQILQSLDWAAGQGARVFNLSFAGPQDRLMGRELEGARARKIVSVAAMGNAGPNTPVLYPAAEASVLAVTATDAADAVFSRANTGNHVAISAPGVDVIAAAPSGQYAFSSGTSIATAHVAGLVALMLERNPDLDLAGVKRILAATAQDLGPKGFDATYGAGRANAEAAVARAAEEAAKRP